MGSLCAPRYARPCPLSCPPLFPSAPVSWPCPPPPRPQPEPALNGDLNAPASRSRPSLSPLQRATATVVDGTASQEDSSQDLPEDVWRVPADPPPALVESISSCYKLNSPQAETRLELRDRASSAAPQALKDCAFMPYGNPSCAPHHSLDDTPLTPSLNPMRAWKPSMVA